MADLTPPKISVRGIRASIPSGFVLGRTDSGSGPVQLIDLKSMQAKGLVPTKLPPTGPAGGDLSGTYPNPSVSKIAGILLNTTAPISGQVLEYDGTKATWTTTGGGVILGSGVPTAVEPAGTLYSRTDTDAVYSSQPTTSAGAAVVQHTHVINPNTGVGSITLGSAPTPGNLVVAFVSWGEANQVQPTVDATKWTQFITDIKGSDVPCFAVYRYAQVGDTSALPAITTAGTSFNAVTVYEISGMTGTFATDVLSTASAHIASSGNSLALSGSTVHNSDLVLTHGGQYDGNHSPTIAGSGSWTLDESAHNASNFGSVGCAHQAVATAGAFNLTWSFTDSDIGTTAMFAVINANIGAAVAGWDLIGPVTPASGANPTAAAGPAAVNGTATTFMRSDGAPAIQKASATQFGIVEVDNTTVTASAGVISATPVGSALASAKILVGNGSGIAAAVAMSGDIAIDNTGKTTAGVAGTWVPADASGNGLTFTVSTALYFRIGNLIYICIDMTWPTTILTGTASFTLPVAAKSGLNQLGVCQITGTSANNGTHTAVADAADLVALQTLSPVSNLTNAQMSGGRLLVSMVYSV